MTANVHVASSANDPRTICDRSFHRRPESERWSAKGVAIIAAIPWTERGINSDRVGLGESLHDGKASASAQSLQCAMQFHVKHAVRHGRALGRPQCEQYGRYGKFTGPGACNNASQNHGPDSCHCHHVGDFMQDVAGLKANANSIHLDL